MARRTAKPSHREEVRILIDEALTKNPHSMEALLELLSASGYTVKRGKNITLMKDGQKNIRLNSLGEGYADLMAQKKSAYAEYAEAKKEMRELLVHKANIEYILGLDEQEQAKEKIRTQEREEK